MIIDNDHILKCSMLFTTYDIWS